MHVHYPKPLHGWREFGGEVGVIVLGVLIALGAQQLMSDWQWRNDVRDADENGAIGQRHEEWFAASHAMVTPCRHRMAIP